MSKANVVVVLVLLGVVFVTLKLLGVITWSWWYVTMPFWVGLAVNVTLVCLFLLLLSAQLVVEGIEATRRSHK
ncbi:MAG: hypothetical protein GY738_02070 [Pseudoalteromonas sp.]|nr:hypothetical protein [Pseudoalteromonas sp.]